MHSTRHAQCYLCCRVEHERDIRDVVAPKHATAADGKGRKSRGAARRYTAESDTAVTRSFALGWHVAELYHRRIPAGPGPAPAQPPEELPGLSSLPELEQARGLFGRIVHAVTVVLPRHPSPVEVKMHAVAALLSADQRSPDEVRMRLAELHVELLQELTAVDSRRGMSYGLGRALAETYLVPLMAEPEHRHDAWTRKFSPHRLYNLYSWLADLKSALPPHAAYAVAGSLRRWEAWVANPAVEEQPVAWDGDMEAVNRTVSRQAQVWKAILSGEKRAVDLLKASDFVDAAGHLLERIADMGVLLYRRMKRVVLAVAGVAAVIVVAAAAVALLTGKAGALWGWVIAGVGGLGASGAFGGTLAKAVRRTETPLWQSELDERIAVAISRLPPGVRATPRPSADVGDLP